MCECGTKMRIESRKADDKIQNRHVRRRRRRETGQTQETLVAGDSGLGPHLDDRVVEAKLGAEPLCLRVLVVRGNRHLPHHPDVLRGGIERRFGCLKIFRNVKISTKDPNNFVHFLLRWSEVPPTGIVWPGQVAVDFLDTDQVIRRSEDGNPGRIETEAGILGLFAVLVLDVDDLKKLSVGQTFVECQELGRCPVLVFDHSRKLEMRKILG